MKILTLIILALLSSVAASAQLNVDSITSELNRKISTERFPNVKIVPKKNFNCRKTKLYAATDDWNATLFRKSKIMTSGVKFETIKYKDAQNKIRALFVNDVLIKLRWDKEVSNNQSQRIIYIRNLYAKSIFLNN